MIGLAVLAPDLRLTFGRRPADPPAPCRPETRARLERIRAELAERAAKSAELLQRAGLAA